MDYLAALFRASQLYAHMAHNLCTGSSFFGDHDFLGKLYPEYESAYDMTVERLIGMGTSVDIPQITEKACRSFCAAAKEDKEKGVEAFFGRLETFEGQIRKLAGEAMKDASEGTKNLLQGFCDQSEARTYLLRQRRKEAKTPKEG